MESECATPAQPANGARNAERYSTRTTSTRRCVKRRGRTTVNVHAQMRIEIPGRITTRIIVPIVSRGMGMGISMGMGTRNRVAVSSFEEDVSS